MRFLIIAITAFIIAITAFIGLIPAIAADSEDLAFDAAAFQADIALLQEAFETLHSGLYRHRSTAELTSAFTEARREAANVGSLDEAFLLLARLTAEVRCGHTYPNFFNQAQPVQTSLFDKRKSIPFLFRLIDGRMLVTASLAQNVAAGDEVLAINGVPVATLIADLSRYQKGDGDRPRVKEYDLSLRGTERFESFDIYFPLLYPPHDGDSYVVSGVRAGGAAFEEPVSAMTRIERRAGFEARDGAISDSPDSKWDFKIYDDGTAYLAAGSFVTWRMTMDWRAYLDDAFSAMKAAETSVLILDVRENGGGDSDVLAALVGHIADRRIASPNIRPIIKQPKVPEHLRPYLGTWDQSFYDLGDRVEALDDGRYLAQDGAAGGREIGPIDGAYNGDIILLIDRANSSATFTLAEALKASDRATLVGEETGGNARGITGGAIFFMTLPGSGLEVDVPIINYEPAGKPADAGVLPHISVPVTLDDVRTGRDPVLEFARERAAKIARGETGQPALSRVKEMGPETERSVELP